MSADSTRAMIAVTALNKMFEDRHFSICTIDDVARMLGIVPDKDAHTQLRPLHCVDWFDMPSDLRQRVPGLIQQALSGDRAFRFELAAEPERESTAALTVIDACKHTRRPLLRRIFGD